VIFPLINKELNEREFNILSKHIAKTFIINNLHEDKSEFLTIDPSSFLGTYNRMYNNAD
jgi:DNA sulfur modification protein DndD